MSKVLYISHGISPFSIGGAIFYQEALIESISTRGWETTCFFPAPRYTLSDRPFLKTWYRNNVKFIELYNSPYLLDHQPDLSEQCTQPNIEKLLEAVLDTEKPDLVHFHELRMHPASLIDVVVKRGIRTIKTMHNYYDICPQHDLMYKNEETCSDFADGQCCVECLSSWPTAHLPFHLRIKRVLTSALPQVALNVYRKIKQAMWPVHQSRRKHVRNDSYELTHYEPEPYYRRRKFFVEQLNKLEVIHCSTDRSAEIFAHYGVSQTRIKVIPLSAKSLDTITPKSLRGDHYPIVFGYMGGVHRHKGYQVLIDAFSKLDQTKSKLIIWNTDISGRLDRNLNIQLKRIYRIDQVNEVLQEIDIGVVPSIWEETFGLIGIEFLTAKIPVIGSRIGGIPQWLSDGESGFLVKPGDVQELVHKMRCFVETPELIAQLQQRIKPWKCFADHVTEMTALYEEIIGCYKR